MKLCEVKVLNHGNDMIQVPRYVYHLTMSTRQQSIQSSGIKPSMGNANYTFRSPRVFCITNIQDHDAIEQVSSMVVTAGLPSIEETHEGDVVVFRVDTTMLANTTWYRDKMYDFKFHDNSYSVWTTRTIPPNALKCIGKIDWGDLNVIPL